MEHCQDCKNPMMTKVEQIACASGDGCCIKTVCGQCKHVCDLCDDESDGSTMMYVERNSKQEKWCKKCLVQYCLDTDTSDLDFFYDFIHETYERGDSLAIDQKVFVHTGNGVLRWYGKSKYCHNKRYG